MKMLFINFDFIDEIETASFFTSSLALTSARFLFLLVFFGLTFIILCINGEWMRINYKNGASIWIFHSLLSSGKRGKWYTSSIEPFIPYFFPISLRKQSLRELSATHNRLTSE